MDNKQFNKDHTINYSPFLTTALLTEQSMSAFSRYARLFKSQQADISGLTRGGYDENYRRCDVTWIPYCDFTRDDFKEYCFRLDEINKSTYNFELTGAENFQYTVYNEDKQGEYKWHIDTADIEDKGVIYTRKLTAVGMLSDVSEYEGGELLVNSSGIETSIKLNKGDVIVFPSWVPHCVTPVTKGTRITLVTWLYGPAFK